ncbi:MAG: aminotransferase class I/II-fold pyridoxal phosphate-dependent enzyme [Proteobacteria bacterium]|nr:aminotransferase class I/II-fold pyridoxal phosphate-dependent enzyme [Pseudomonadota bacterium]
MAGGTITVVRRLDGIDVSRLVNLSLNENAWGTVPGAVGAAADAATHAALYADTRAWTLREAIGTFYGVDPACVVPGNGSEEILDIVGRVYARPGDEILAPALSFAQFRIVAWRLGVDYVESPTAGELDADIEALIAAVTPRTRVVYLANPGNPTGRGIDSATLLRLADALPGNVVLVLDCAYAEFGDPGAAATALRLAQERTNVLTTRTFSKAWGMAGLRLGWGVAMPEMADALNAMRGIGNVSGPTQAAGIAGLRHPDTPAWLARTGAAVIRGRDLLTGSLRQAGYAVPDSQTNFVMARVPGGAGVTAAGLVRRVAEAGALIRACDDYGLDDWLRISIGQDGPMRIVAHTLAAVIDPSRQT